MYDVTKIISALKGKRGDHRVFRLAENLCMNLIFSLRDFFFVKREGKVGELNDINAEYKLYYVFLLHISLKLNFLCSERVQLNLRRH